MALICIIKVIPSSGRSAWTLDKSGILKCYLKSAPEKGKANKELIKMLADALSIEQKRISIVGGLTSRTKRIKIDLAINLSQLCEKLHLDYQQKVC
ncbi:DUF167 domain-containing protein [Candidatus Dependentiae bacterium]|nr:MAG: DUF167 domain-containing protein [Candidatus Dependentiae bacterium]